MKAKATRLLFTALLALPALAHAVVTKVEDTTPRTDADADAAYRAAQKAFQNSQLNSAPVSDTTVTGLVKPADTVSGTTPQVTVYSDPSRVIGAPGAVKYPSNIALENINVVIDVENTSLRDIMYKVVSQAARYTGPWQVKWRLKPENMGLMDERVNLTAEAKFSDFVDLLTERIKNMSGVQLFITTFNSSRIIMVADTYY